MSRQIAMGEPQRIQRQRTKGWRAPAGAVYVGRGTRWGNPTRVMYRRDTGAWHAEHDNGGAVGGFQTAAEARRFAVAAYEHHLDTHPYLAKAVRELLAARDLMCWCPVGEPCHADVLLRVANGGEA